jgi:hypothetical protein
MTGAFLITPVTLECLHRITGLQFKTPRFESHLCFLPFIFCFSARASSGPRPPHSRGLQITLNDTPQSVGLLWTSDQLVAETST